MQVSFYFKRTSAAKDSTHGRRIHRVEKKGTKAILLKRPRLVLRQDNSTLACQFHFCADTLPW